MKHRLLEHLNEYFFGHLKTLRSDEEVDDELVEFLLKTANEQLALLKCSDRKKTKKKKKGK